MIFPTLEFAAFFAVVLPVSWALMPHPRVWKPFMISASFFFYGSADWHYVFLLAFCIVWNQLFSVVVSRLPDLPGLRKLVLGLAVAGDLALLGWFQYYGFFVDSAATLPSHLGLPLPLPLLEVALPVGISFFTFLAISYVISVYLGTLAPVRAIHFAPFH